MKRRRPYTANIESMVRAGHGVGHAHDRRLASGAVGYKPSRVVRVRVLMRCPLLILDLAAQQ